MPLNHVFNLQNQSEFQQAALETFRFQAAHNTVYQQFINALGKESHQIQHYTQIPFLPISFFKTQKVICGNAQAEMVFSSSGTTQQSTSKHHVTDLNWYENSYLYGFQQFYGNISDYCILALLPSYLEREGSSLIYMVDDLIQKSEHPQSGFFLHNHLELFHTLQHLKETQQKTLLIGVSFALLDFVEQYTLSFPELIIMETGGMKGKRKELIREELHRTLCNGFGVKTIHAEYGMTELLSQAYSYGNGLFRCPPWMQVLIRDTNDPLNLLPHGKTGGINIIDLANRNSCAFIATQDLGKTHSDGSFEILGRFDHSDIRGCNLLVQ